MAEPGGICLSGEAFVQVQRRLPLNFTDLGEQQLKNIAQPVRVYRVHASQVTIVATYKPALTLPDKPSIAVLPFTNLTGDPKEDYFSDGITEDIITELSRFSELFVIARNSSFQYKGKSVDVRQISRELGVRYVLEGSIRRGGDRVRITGQLIDATTGTHRWAERYDRNLEDVFAVQDEVARTIVGLLVAHVNKAEIERTVLKPPATWNAYDYYMRAVDTFDAYWSSFNVQELYEARRLFEEALATDPRFARGYARLAWTYFTAWSNRLDGDFLKDAILEKAYELARQAVQLDPNLPEARARFGYISGRMGKHDTAIAEFQRAMMLNPNFTDFHFCATLVFAGEAAQGIKVIKRHVRADPFYLPFATCYLGFACYMLKQYFDALPPLHESAARAPNSRMFHVLLAATYAQLGQVEQARKAAKQVLRIEPTYTIEGTQRKLSVFKQPGDVEHFFDGLRKAGLPQK
jgi:adenylate cyclase